MRTIKAYSKPTHRIQMNVIHGGVYTYNEGIQTVMYAHTNKSDAEIIEVAKSECERLGIELLKIEVIGSKPTSFNTNATWCDEVLYSDESDAMYFEGYFDKKGNKVE